MVRLSGLFCTSKDGGRRYMCAFFKEEGSKQRNALEKWNTHCAGWVRLEIDHRAEKTNPSNRGGEVLFIWLSRLLETHPMQRPSGEGRTQQYGDVIQHALFIPGGI